jgi:hypothetical protein
LRVQTAQGVAAKVPWFSFADLRLDNIRPKPSLHSTAAASTIEREFEAASNTLDPLHEELHVQLGELKFGKSKPWF